MLSSFLIFLGIIFLGLLIAIIGGWTINLKNRLQPRYIKETQRWYWLMVKPTRIWAEKNYRWKVKWIDWDMGYAKWIRKTNSVPLPDIGDIITVRGRWNRLYVLMIISLVPVSENICNIETCYLGHLKPTEGFKC